MSTISKEEIKSREILKRKIFFIRGYKIMISTDLAELYQVPAKVLIQAMKRNLERFPDDFSFQLTWDEVETLRTQKQKADELSSRSQFVTLKKGKNLKYLPYAFTEQGVAMLSSVLKSRRAILMNIAIMRVFVLFREAAVAHKELAFRLNELESRVGRHDEEIHQIFEAIRRLITEEEKPKLPVGFHVYK